MLKYQEIINKLTLDQKVRLLTGVGDISGKDMKILGIPSIKYGNISDYGRDIFPHAASMARAWNPNLWERVAAAKADAMMEENVSFAIVPGAKVKFSPYRKDISEDPYLASLLSGTYMKAASQRGITVAASGYYLTEADARWLDTHPNERVINEYLVQPYQKAAEIASSHNIVTDVRYNKGDYADSCQYIQRRVVGSSEFLVCEKASDESTVDMISRGIICFQASSNVLDAAVKKYLKISAQAAQGKDDAAFLIEDAIADKTAISEEMLDQSLDTVLDFVFKLNENTDSPKEETAQSQKLELQSIVESTVLLKNQDNLLPLTKDKKIVLVGDCKKEDENGLAARCSQALASRGYKRVDVVKGYDTADYHYDCQADAGLIQKADVAVLFLSMDRQTENNVAQIEKLTLPANQLYCVEQVVNLAKKTVVVVLSNHTPDVDFAQYADSVLLTPSEVKQSFAAIAGILSDEFAPSGKLAATLYARTETVFPKAAVYKHKFGCKVGPFIGYRYYDSADMVVGYPFGHGLTYTEFRYSSLSVSENEVSFTVKNVGNRRGCEIAQVYVGAQKSSVARPKKELCGFAKVDLLPNEKKKITVRFETPKVFDEGDFVTEDGNYSVYVGASVSDVRLTGRYRINGKVLNEDNHNLSDYLQSHSNILKDKYTLEAKSISMKRKFKNIMIGVGSLCLAVSLAVFNVTMNLSSLFLGCVSGLLALVAVLFFILDVVERNREYAKEENDLEELNQQAFADAEQLSVVSTERMFADEFDLAKEEDLISEHVVSEEDETEDASYINDDFRIKDAVAEFNKFALERGYKLGAGVAESLFSSLTISRVMLFTGISSKDFNTFIRLVSEYFECLVSVDDASDVTPDQKNAYYTYDANGDCMNKNILLALRTASGSHKSVQVAAIDNLKPDVTDLWLGAFARYVRTTRVKNEIVVVDGYGKRNSFYIARNLWLAIRLADGCSPDMLSADTLKFVSVIKVSFSVCEPVNNLMLSHGFTSQQADYMLRKEVGKYEVNEDVWKKIDKLEAYAKEHSGYTIGNKLWLELEKQVEMLLACGFDLNDAIDAAVAIKVLPSMTSALQDKIGKEERTLLQTMEFVFGDDNIRYSKAYLDGVKANAKEKKADRAEENE